MQLQKNSSLLPNDRLTKYNDYQLLRYCKESGEEYIFTTKNTENGSFCTIKFRNTEDYVNESNHDKRKDPHFWDTAMEYSQLLLRMICLSNYLNFEGTHYVKENWKEEPENEI